MKFAIVEKKDHLAVHGYFDTRASAERHLQQTVPAYVVKGYFMDKTLQASDFEVIAQTMKTRRKAGIKQGRRELAMYRQKRLILAACKLWELRRFGKVIQ